MQKEPKEICPHCKRAMNVRKDHLSKSLASCLLKIAAVCGPMDTFNTRVLAEQKIITWSDSTNISHLKALGLVEKVGECRWRITARGIDLIEGGFIPAWVKTFNDHVIEVSHDVMQLKDAIGYYERPQKWAEKMERVHPLTETQSNLF